MLEWNVFTDDYNSKKIEIYNVFEHNRFFEDCKKNAKKNIHDYNAFCEQLKRDAMYYYWSKCEWEIMIMPWIYKEAKSLKIDVFDQLKLNWETFCKYTWEHGAELRRRDKNGKNNT